MLKTKYSGVNDGKPYPVDMVAFKDGDSVSDLSVENGELKLNGETVGGGSGKERKVLFSDTLQLTTPIMGMGNMSGTETTLPVTTFEAGKTYIVTYNGVEYPCICISQEGGVALGNTGMLEGTDTGEPFVIFTHIGASTVGILDLNKAESCTISIAIETSGGGGGNVVSAVFEITQDEEENYIVNCNKTPAEVVDAIKNGNLTAKCTLFLDDFYSWHQRGTFTMFGVVEMINIEDGEFQGAMCLFNCGEEMEVKISVSLNVENADWEFTADV